MPVEAVFPEQIDASAGMDAPERENVLCAFDAPKHARLLTPTPNEGLAARLNDAGPDEEALTTEGAVLHPGDIAPEVAQRLFDGLRVFDARTVGDGAANCQDGCIFDAHKTALENARVKERERVTQELEQQYGWAKTLDRAVVEQGADLGKPIALQAYNGPGSDSPTDLLYDDSYKSKVIAGFGQLAFDLPGRVELAVALRYDREKRDVSNNVPRAVAPFLQTCSLAPNCFINPYYNVNPTATSIPDRSKTYSQFQPKLTLNWKATDDFSVYASYGYGFRSGGFNSLGSAATIQSFYLANGINSAVNVQDEYKKEVAKAAEVGFKSMFFDRRVSINAAIFHTKVDNMQFFEFFAGPFGLLRVVTNIDEVTLKGAEIDARFRATEYLTFGLGAAITKGNIDANANRPFTVGNDVPYAPKATGNATAELKLPLGGSGWKWLTRVEGVYTGKTWFHTVQNNTIAPTLFSPFAAFFGLPGDAFNGNFGNTQRDAFTLLNGRIGFSSDNVSIAAFGRNLTNKRYLAEIIPAPEFGGSFIHDAPGRSFGVEASYSFK